MGNVTSRMFRLDLTSVSYQTNSLNNPHDGIRHNIQLLIKNLFKDQESVYCVLDGLCHICFR